MTIPRSAIRSTAPPAQWLSGTSGNEDCAKAPPAVTAARSVTRNLFILYYPLKLADLAFSAASAERAQSAWSFRVSSRQSSLPDFFCRATVILEPVQVGAPPSGATRFTQFPAQVSHAVSRSVNADVERMRHRNGVFNGQILILGGNRRTCLISFSC